MTRFRRNFGSLTLAGALLIGGAACSSSSKTAATVTTSVAPKGVRSSTTLALKTGSGGNKAAFCAEVAAIGKDPALQGDTSTGPALAKAKAAYAKLAATAPSAVKADILYLSDYLTAIGEAGKDPVKQAANLKKFDAKATTTHSTNLTQFVTQSCSTIAAG